MFSTEHFELLLFGKDCRVTTIVVSRTKIYSVKVCDVIGLVSGLLWSILVRDCRRQVQLFAFELKIAVFLQKVCYKVAVFVLLNAAGAVADCSMWFYH